MHKKEARKRKKLMNQIRQHRVMPDGRVLTADGRETLLGNLARVKHIPMLPWKRIIAFPTIQDKITVSTVGETAWFYELLKETPTKEHDLLGFTPVKSLDEKGFEDISIGKIGMAAQICGVEEIENEKAIVHLKGICRYEIVGFLPSAENHFEVNVKWFEDNREADSLVRPQYEAALKIIERLAKSAGANVQKSFATAKIFHYDFSAAQYLSFAMFHTFCEWFTDEDDLEVVRSRSTAARLRKLVERSEKHLPEMERRFKKVAKLMKN